MSQQVIIFDTTLRDGEQALQASLSVKEKIQIAMALERMGVDVMEVGFPVSSLGTSSRYKPLPARSKTAAFVVWHAVLITTLTSLPKHYAWPRPSVFTSSWPPPPCISNPN